jgi:hypothetical protein
MKSMKKVDVKEKDFQTTLSSHEVAQGYEDVVQL